jgi:hypothetical protein
MSLPDVPTAIAAQLEAVLGPVVPELQVVGHRWFNPTPPALDVYPAPTFLTQNAFRIHEAIWTVRARVSTADNAAGQELLLELLDPYGPASVRAALRSDPTFAGAVEDSGLAQDFPDASGYQVYRDTDAGPDFLGCEWTLRVVLALPAEPVAAGLVEAVEP